MTTNLSHTKCVLSKDRHFLAAKDSGGSVILLKFVHWNPREFPILTWCWKSQRIASGRG